MELDIENVAILKAQVLRRDTEFRCANFMQNWRKNVDEQIQTPGQ